MSLGLGAAYVHFDMKDKLWKPLIAQFAKTDEAVEQSAQP